MKLSGILKKVGVGLIRDMVPGGGLILDIVNEFLPSGGKLGQGATGEQLSRAVQSLPPEQQAQIMGREFDVEETQIKQSYSTVRAMLEQDAANPHSTRPYIAKGAFQVVAAVVLVMVAMWAHGIGSGDAAIVKAVTDGWPFVLAVIAPLVTLLYAYFGVLKTEQKNRLDAAGGNSTPGGFTGMVTSLLNRGR